MKKRISYASIIYGTCITLLCSVLLINILSGNKNRKPLPPLATIQNVPVVLDFNTPTPSPTLTPTPTPKPTSTPAPTLTPTPTPIPVTGEQLDRWFTQYANHYSVDRSLLWRIAACESGLKTNVTNWIYGGVFQFSPNTWRANRTLMGMDTNPDLRFNPEEAIKTAAFVLSTRGAGAWPSCSKR